jgi:plasmid rolling circle replication initiator protein Rep
MIECQEEKILKDLNSKGKLRDWRGKKISSLNLSDVYKSIADKIKSEYKKRGVHIRYKQVRRKIKDENGNITGVTVSDESAGLYDENGKRVVNYEKRAENMRFCGSCLDFADIDDKFKKLKLIKANFCRVPLCPMCQWRKSLRVFFGTSKIIDEVENRDKNIKHIFLTLTVKNCTIENLANTLDNMFKSWDIFMHSRTLRPKIKGEVRHIVKGWFRALEVEYNSETNEFHPHFHAILNVDKSYFKNTDYLTTAEWVQLWRKSAKLDYDPTCWVEKVKNNGNRKGIMEVAKYTYKDAEILHDKLSDDTKGDVIKNLSSALHQRRLYAYGGIMKEIAAELKIKDADKADLVKVDDDKINVLVVKAVLKYRWNMGVSNYILSEKIINNTEKVSE